MSSLASLAHSGLFPKGQLNVAQDASPGYTGACSAVPIGKLVLLILVSPEGTIECSPGRESWVHWAEAE